MSVGPHERLPYTDAKPVGSADFYFAINATFRFIEERLGVESLRQYWQELGERYYAPVSASWARQGLPAVAAYWRAFFDAEPGSDVEVKESPAQVTLEVKCCPAFKHLRAAGREIFPRYCQHCYFVSEAIARPAGLTVRIEGGNGACRQSFLSHAGKPPVQDLAQIKEAS